MLSILYSETVDSDLQESLYSEPAADEMKDQSSLSMDDTFMKKNLYFHDFQNPSRTCECGLSILEYWDEPNKSVCPVVCDGLCDLLPMLPD